VNRALAWLVGGLVLLALGIVAIAPELLGDLEAAGGILAVALGALIPAVLVAAVFASVRRRRGGSAPGGRAARADDRSDHPSDDLGA
jgi:hypothetical protein